MRKFAFPLLSLAAFAALAACEAPSQAGYYGANAPIATSRAAGFFQTVCVSNSADLSAARQTLAGLPVIRNSEDDIFYSTENYISFKITPVSQFETVCSMVWDPIEDNARSMAVLRGLDPTAQLRDNEDGTISAFHYGAP